MSRKIEFEISSEFERVPLLAAAVKGALEAAHVDAKTAGTVERCVGEWSKNVIEHGYASEAGYPLRISLVVYVNNVRVLIRDSARPFDPVARLEAREDSIGADPAELFSSLPERGMGLAMIRTLMDELSYQRMLDGNALELVRRRSEH